MNRPVRHVAGIGHDCFMSTITRLFDIPYRQKKLFPKKDCLASKVNGVWKVYSIDEFISISETFAKGLLAVGFTKGDSIGIISGNRPEWNFTDLGMLQIGVTNVPLYTSLSEPEIAFILNDSKAKAVLVGDANLLVKIQNVRSQVSSLREIYTFDHINGAKHWTAILDEAKKFSGDLEAIRSSIAPSDIATMLYTSGTTGTPKGVMLMHSNIVSNILASEDLCPVGAQHRALSFLPLCHSYERMLTYMYMHTGVSIYYAESMDKISDNLKELQPHVFSTVPRLLEKVYDRIVTKGKELSGIKKGLFFWALNLGLRYELNGKNGWWYELQLKLANKLIFSKWREALGGNIRVIVSGGAALQPRLARVFWSAKIPVLEGYGLTETSPVISVNNFKPNGAAFGTVGTVIKDVQINIAEDGEILCKGPNVMKGYFNRPDLTAEAIDRDGWFHTGDIGQMIDNRFLKITDRKKEIFKTSGGKYIAPQALENKFKESLFIEQLMVIGENRRFPSALILPDFNNLNKWCEDHNLPSGTREELINRPEIVARIQEEVDRLNKEFGQTEQIKKFALLSKEWNTDSGDLTATLKLKRKVILERNAEAIEKIYAE